MIECRHPKCTSPAVVRPTLLVHPRFRPVDYHAPPAECRLGLDVCLVHKLITTVNDLVNEKAWNEIVDLFKKADRAEPDHDTLEIRWDPITQEEGHALFH